MYDELEVINYLLSQVGAAPVSNLNNPLPDIVSAQLRLNEASIWVQKRGWWFNKVLAQTLVPDGSGEIALPPQTLKVVSPFNTFVINRDDKLYDPFRDSFEFTEPVTVDITLLMDWEQLPGSVQDVIMYRAGQQMVLHELEDTNKAALLEDDIQEGLLILNREDLEIKQRNVINLTAVQKMLYRVRPYRRYNVRNPNIPGGGL